MGSSNRHWPSMFKSKPCNNQQWSESQDHHQSSILSNNSCGRSSSSNINSPFSSGEERSPDPKPRWNPKPEQIRILEAIFNSGMVNPPRDEIRRIRAQLQEYGQVGDANVFYWFQNRKSRSKHKQRTLQAKINATTTTTLGTHHSPPLPTPSSSISSEKASPQTVAPSPRSGGGSSSYNSSNNSINNSNNNNVVVEQFGNSPTSDNQSSNTYFHQLEPLLFPLHQSGGGSMVGDFSQGLCFGTSPQDGGGGGCGGGGGGGFSSILVGDVFGGCGHGGSDDDHLKRDNEVEKYKFQHELSFLGTSPTNVSTCTMSPTSHAVLTPTSRAIPSSLGQILGLVEAGGLAGKSTVFINGMAIEVPVGPINVKEEFGEGAILINSSSGHPVATNEWGISLHPLQNGASYYLVGSVAASPLLDKLDTNLDVLAPGFPYQI